MAVILFNIRNNPVYIAKEESDLKLHRGDLEDIKADGRLKTISQDEYNSLLTKEKTAQLVGDSVVLEDVENHDGNDGTVSISMSSDDFDSMKNMYLEKVSNILDSKDSDLKREGLDSLKTRLQAFKSGLMNVDKSSITFPLTVNFAKYWVDNESSEFFDDQFIS